jgi:hypothetical protein
MEYFKQQIRDALKDVERPDLYMAAIAATTAWLITVLIRAGVHAVFWSA